MGNQKLYKVSVTKLVQNEWGNHIPCPPLIFYGHYSSEEEAESKLRYKNKLHNHVEGNDEIKYIFAFTIVNDDTKNDIDISKEKEEPKHGFEQLTLF